ncbi:MAG: beta-N-acetylhexosaminidase [Oscillospiraceae bacterium]|nr:beta-N-acetylhexosaminidase [Oscillospiraceae bacterium]
MPKIAAVALALLLCAGCVHPPAPTAPSPTPKPPPSPSNYPSPIPEETPFPSPTPISELSPVPSVDPIKEQLRKLTVEQKVGQMLMAGIEGLTPGADAETAVSELQVGGIILFDRNVADAEQLSALTASLRTMNGTHIPLLLGVDEEGGRVSRMPPEVFPALPPAFELRDHAALGGVLAAECLTFGFNLDFAPVLDIWSNPQNTVIGDRAYGARWEVVAEAGVAVMNGISAAGVIPVVKHFPGHGDTTADSHTELPIVARSLPELRERELKPFQAAIDNGAPVVMMGHILAEALDPLLPASLSPSAITDLLRGEMGFTGVVCTDDLLMGAITGRYGLGEACVLAAEAGCDLLLVCHGADALREGYDALLEAVGSGRLTETRLDESVTRLLTLKAKYPPPEDPPTPDELNAMLRGFLG